MQETSFMLKWLSGFFDAEGCVRVNKSVNGNCTAYSPRLCVVNTDFYVIEYVVSFLSSLGINCYVQERKVTGNRKPIKVIEINRITKVFDLCMLLLNHSITKSKELGILLHFCYSRINKFEGNVRSKKEPYSLEEIKFYKDLIEYKAHKKGKRCLSYEPLDLELVYPIEVEWLAGFLDGDGLLNINLVGTPSLSFGTTHPATFNSIKNFFDMKNIFYYKSSVLPAKNHLESCKLRCSSLFVNTPVDIIKVLDFIEPFLFSKKNQAKILRRFCNTRKNNKYQRLSADEKLLIQEITKLNK